MPIPHMPQVPEEWIRYEPDGTPVIRIPSDALYAADMLDYEFEELTDEMRKAREGDSERDA